MQSPVPMAHPTLFLSTAGPEKVPSQGRSSGAWMSSKDTLTNHAYVFSQILVEKHGSQPLLTIGLSRLASLAPQSPD